MWKFVLYVNEMNSSNRLKLNDLLANASLPRNEGFCKFVTYGRNEFIESTPATGDPSDGWRRQSQPGQSRRIFVVSSDPFKIYLFVTYKLLTYIYLLTFTYILLAYIYLHTTCLHTTYLRLLKLVLFSICGITMHYQLTNTSIAMPCWTYVN
jgi:hypothetical protein